MKNKANYVNKKIKELEVLRFKEKVSRLKNLLLGSASVMLFALPAVAISNWVMQVSILLGLLGLIAAEGTIYCMVSNNHEIKAINDEIRHLNNIKKQGIKTGNDRNVKRLERIDDLENQQNDVQKRENINMIPMYMGGAVWIGAAFGSLINSTMPMVSLAGALVTTCSLIKSSLGEKEYLELQSRIDNLRNDIELVPVYGIDNDDKKKSNIKSLNSNSKSYTSTKALASTEDELIVDRYLKSLENIESEKPLQYTKK
jgi:hypothetical protein